MGQRLLQLLQKALLGAYISPQQTKWRLLHVKRNQLGANIEFFQEALGFE